jgi:SpoU rRNA methylase family enzyme
MELALFSLMYGVSVTVLTNINDAIDICQGEDLFLFYPGTKEIYDMLWSNKKFPTIDQKMFLFSHTMLGHLL